MDKEERAHLVHEAGTREWVDRKGNVHDHRDGVRIVFDQPPDFIYDREGQIAGVDAWVRAFAPSGREIRIDPHRRIINPPTMREGQSDPLEAFRVAVAQSIRDTPNPRGWRTAGTVDTIYGITGDGYIQSDSGTYSTARSGSNLLPDNGTPDLYVGQAAFSGPTTYYCFESFCGFDTSAIPDANVVSAVTLSLYMSNDQTTTDFTLQVRTKDWSNGGGLTTADWVAGASLTSGTLLASMSTAGISVGYITPTSVAAFLTAPGMKTGTVYVMLCSSRHASGNTPTLDTVEFLEMRSADASGTTEDPYLTITHTGTGGRQPITRRPTRTLIVR